MSSPAVHQLIYVSAATARFTRQALSDLLLVARTNNTRLGVSGLLVHHEGSFLQVLEGEPTLVEPLFGRIERDKRHHRTLVLSRQLVPKHSFSDWSMGFVEADPRVINALPGFTDFFRAGFQLHSGSEPSGRAQQLLSAFRDGRFRQHVDF